jgi:signal transduction histidine kinase
MSDNGKIDILVVDDLPEKFLVYESILDEPGQRLVKASSGEEALKLVLRQEFAVILLDVYMPGLDGFETARLIRQRKRSAHTPIIFLTAFADEARAARGYAHGAVDYISTPIVPEILRAKVRVFVELFRMRQQVARQAEEKALRAAAEEAARRSAFLAEASRVLGGSLDVEVTLPLLARLCIPRLADLSFVCLADARGEPGRLEGAWNEGGVARPASEVDRPVPGWLRGSIRQALATGKAERPSGLDPGGPLESALILPLSARGRTLGALALGTAGRRHDADEVALAEDFAGRAAAALDNALLVHDIQENDRHRNEFLAMLAHELRNPLAPIRNAVHILRLVPPATSVIAEARDVIDRQVTHLVRLVDDLLDVSRISRGKIHLQLAAVEAAAVVHSAVETSRPLIDERRHDLVLSLPAEPVRLEADPVRMAQVLSNLLNNAAKYTDPGGRIWLGVEADAGEVVFRVRDSGLGIAPEMLPRIFDLFIQADKSLDRAHGGLGVGLTLVRFLVGMHGGRVEAHSAGPGHGSEFVVRLPRTPETSLQPAPAPGAGARPAAARRILVVDDNVDAASSLGWLLRLDGHEVRLAHDGPAALGVGREFRPDTVLLDIGLPGMSGFEVARQFREEAATRGALLVAVTGYSQGEDRRRSREAGFDQHLIKPVQLSDLREVLAEGGSRGGRGRAAHQESPSRGGERTGGT